MSWWIVVAAVLVSFALKLVGLLVPARLLERPAVNRLSVVMPVALLGALVASETFTTEGHLVLDSRAVGLAVAVVALRLRAPFIVVVAVAAAATAGTRLVTGMA